MVSNWSDCAIFTSSKAMMSPACILVTALMVLSFSAGERKTLSPKKSRLTYDSPIPVRSPFYFLEKQKSVDPVITTDSADCIIPFSRAGNLIVVQASIDGQQGNFILDTGAPRLILNMTYFRSYPSAPEEGESGGITGRVAASPTSVSTLSLGGVHYTRLDADRFNLGHIENSKGIKVLGLLGMELFRRFEMIIDYENKVLRLHLLTRKEAKSYQHPMLADTAAYSTYRIDLKDDKVLTYAEMNGKKLTFIIDTGAESNVLDSRLPDKVFENLTINKRVIITGSGTTKVEALQGDVKEIKMGSRTIASLPVLVTNLEKMCTAYDRCLDGMLGFDFLSMHKIGFNFVTGKMYIWK